MELTVDKSTFNNYGNQADSVKQQPAKDKDYEVVKVVYIKVPADELKTDIKRGGIPTLKGVGAGAAAGAVAGIGTLVGPCFRKYRKLKPIALKIKNILL